jgi:diguanylate cyclase (GGDEF)-like protein
VEELVELNLRPAEALGSDLGDFVHRIIRSLAAVTPEHPSPETADLKLQLEDYRQQLAEVRHSQELRIVAAGCASTCDQYLRQVHSDQVLRETGLTEVITLLREAAGRMIGDSSEMHAQLSSSADRFKTMVRIDDIRELKKQLTSEVSSLQQVIAEKHQRDQQIIAKLSKRVEVLQADLVKVEEEASLDPLTRVPNRGSFDRALARMIAAQRAGDQPLTLAMIDIDHFKRVNDTHGHQVGDRVLLCTAEWLRNAIRSSDVVARYGGEEFSVILPNADLTQATRRFEQVLTKIAAHNYDYEVGEERKSVQFTVSCGLAQLTSRDTPETLLFRADAALYEAKRKGRNRVVAKKPSLIDQIRGL